MNEIEIPIIKKSYDLYKIFHEYRNVVSKQDRHTIYERCDLAILSLLERFFEAGYSHDNKQSFLEQGSSKLNLIRLFIRLMKDTKSMDSKKYIEFQIVIDEIGRMLGGWIRSTASAR